VRSLFVPYSKDLNAELVRYIFGIYQSSGIPMSDEPIEEVIAYPDSLICLGDVASTGGARADGGIAGAGGMTATGGMIATGGATSTGGAAGLVAGWVSVGIGVWIRRRGRRS
jgi:hypothetical protein